MYGIYIFTVFKALECNNHVYLNVMYRIIL